MSAHTSCTINRGGWPSVNTHENTLLTSRHNSEHALGHKSTKEAYRRPSTNQGYKPTEANSASRPESKLWKIMRPWDDEAPCVEEIWL
jgi:hypothetical protein